jgi:hypothetical protein
MRMGQRIFPDLIPVDNQLVFRNQKNFFTRGVTREIIQTTFLPRGLSPPIDLAVSKHPMISKPEPKLSGFGHLCSAPLQNPKTYGIKADATQTTRRRGNT